MNRIQATVLGFLLFAWLSLAVILALAPEVFSSALQLGGVNDRLLGALFLATLSVFLLVLAAGVVRRWRWTFWLVLVAFFFGILRVPTTILQLSGILRADTPAWYAVLQGLLGVVQFVIALAMLHAYRRSGVWGAS